MRTADLLYNMALAKHAAALRDYAAHSALNLGQAARDLRYFTDHPHANKLHRPGTAAHALASALAFRTPSLANNLWFAALPPGLHHKPEEIEGLADQHSLKEWFQLGYKPWIYGPKYEPERHLPEEETEPGKKEAGLLERVQAFRQGARERASLVRGAGYATSFLPPLLFVPGSGLALAAAAPRLVDGAAERVERWLKPRDGETSSKERV